MRRLKKYNEKTYKQNIKRYLSLYTLDKPLKNVYKFCGFIAAIFLILMASCILLQILGRIFDFYIPGLMEYAGYCMSSSVFFSLAWTFQEKGHIRFELLLNTVSPSLRWGLECIGAFVAFCISVFFCYFFIRLTFVSYIFLEKSDGPEAILLWVPQSMSSLGILIFTIGLFHHFLEQLSDYKKIFKSSD